MADHAILFRVAERRARGATLFFQGSIITSALLTAAALWDFHLWGRIGTGIDVSPGELQLNHRIALALDCLDLAIFLGAAIAFLTWFHRVAANLPALGIADARWSPVWAVAWWFVPLMFFFRPYQVAMDIWQASDPAATTEYWRTRPVQPLLNRWWGFFVASMVVEWMAFCAWTRIDDGTPALLHQGASLLDGIAAVLRLAGAWLAIRVVEEIQHRQIQRARLFAFR